VAKSPSFREVERLLRKHDKRFEFWSNKGKGGHRMISHPDIAGKKRSCPIPFHGATRPVSRAVLKSIARAFDLTKDFFK